jgi:hypothetical protein
MDKYAGAKKFNKWTKTSSPKEKKQLKKKT